MTYKQKKIFKIIISILVIVLISELIYFGIKYLKTRENSTYYTVINSLVKENNNYIGAGFSDYRNSKFNKYQNGLNKATIFKYSNNKITEEYSLNLGYNSYYNDIIKVSDGYIAVGSIEMTEEHKNEKLSEGLIVKYDNDFNVVWRKNVNVIGKTELFKIKADNDKNYVIVGSSVYGEGYIGNHKTGGGILLKINDKGEELFRINNGGPYYGRFNDLIVEKNGYVVVGLGKANSGIIIKYDLKGKEVWKKSYGYTTNTGMNAITKLNNNYVVATTKVIDPKDLSNYQSAIIMYDENGKEIDSIKYKENDITYFNDIKVYNDSIVVCGYTGNLSNNLVKSDAIMVTFDKDLKETNKEILKEENNDFYKNIYLDKNIILLGYTNSKIKDYKTNGYDYFPFIKEF